MDRVVLQRGGQGQIHQGPDLLQNHLPAAGLGQNLPVLVDLFLRVNIAERRGLSVNMSSIRSSTVNTTESNRYFQLQCLRYLPLKRVEPLVSQIAVGCLRGR